MEIKKKSYGYILDLSQNFGNPCFSEFEKKLIFMKYHPRTPFIENLTTNATLLEYSKFLFRYFLWIFLNTMYLACLTSIENSSSSKLSFFWSSTSNRDSRASIFSRWIWKNIFWKFFFKSFDADHIISNWLKLFFL